MVMHLHCYELAYFAAGLSRESICIAGSLELGQLVASAFEGELEEMIFGKVGHYVPFGMEEARAATLLPIQP